MLASTYVLTMGLTLSLSPVARAAGLIDHPGGRKTHISPTPMTGGLGIYLGLISVCILSPVLMAQYQILLLLSGLVLITGVIDDLYDTRASVRLLFHAGAALAMALFADVRLDTLGSLLFGAPIQLGILSLPLTAFATVGVINAVNMSDGLDGLSSGLVTIALGFLSLSAMVADANSVLSFSQLLGVTLIAFLTLNFRMLWNKTALVYLGDAGSTLLGFILAWLLIASSQGSDAFIAPVYALWFFAIPLIDTVSLLIRRPLQGKSPFTPGRDHLHHKLQRAGFSQKQTVLILYGAAITLASVGLGAHLAGASEGVMFLLFMTLFGVYFSVSQQNPIIKQAVSLGLEVVGSGDALDGGRSAENPRHIAVIMDGNNRWAKQRGLRLKDGHRQGAIACRSLIKDCIALQIPYLTLFAFSSENWLRSKNEVRSLMALFRSIMARNEIADLHAAGAKIQFIGNRSNFSQILLAGMAEIEERTANNTAITVTVALDYGGKWDIAQAARKYIEEHRQNGSTDEQGDIEEFGLGLTKHLSTNDLPDPDLCIRTAGERRLSNFLLWQFAYTELYFSETYWPDFTVKDLRAALDNYSKRDRKYGQRPC